MVAHTPKSGAGLGKRSNESYWATFQPCGNICYAVQDKVVLTVKYLNEILVSGYGDSNKSYCQCGVLGTVQRIALLSLWITNLHENLLCEYYNESYYAVLLVVLKLLLVFLFFQNVAQRNLNLLPFFAHILSYALPYFVLKKVPEERIKKIRLVMTKG